MGGINGSEVVVVLVKIENGSRNIESEGAGARGIVGKVGYVIKESVSWLMPGPGIRSSLTGYQATVPKHIAYDRISGCV